MKYEKSNSALRILKKTGISALAVATFMGSSSTAFATIDNTAVATGTFGGSPTSSPGSTVNVDVVPLGRDLDITKSIASGPTTGLGGDAANTDAGDTVTYRFIVTNSGNATETNVTPADPGPLFNGVAGAGTLSGFTEVAGGTGTAASLAPGETVFFDATYTFAAVDIYRAAGITDGVTNVATVSSDDHIDPDPSPPGTSEITIPNNPALVVAKSFVLNETQGDTGDGLAETDDTITYTYTVTNSGNVPLINVGVQDTHEGALLVFPSAPRDETITTEGPLAVSDLGLADDGVIDQLEPGAIATFTYVHTVTQAEVDAQ